MALSEALSERLFTLADQIEFATLSGDWNPMHVDAVAARRTQAGSPVVHGVHAAAWALDAYIRKFGPLLSPILLTVRFDRFIYLDHVVEARVAERGQSGFLILLSVDGAKVASIKAEATAQQLSDPPTWPFALGSRPLDEARDLNLTDLVDARGQFAPLAAAPGLSAAFPGLVGNFGADAVRSLVALSTLVGMHAPGLHSIFSKISVVLHDATGEGELSYRVTKVQALLRAVEIDVAAPGLSGSVSCFVRRPPVPQPSTASLKTLRTPDCAGHRVLIVGGSRGLGEVTAKLCALGGAEVTVTYATGQHDAEAVRDDIVASGGRCAIMRLDVTEPIGPQLGGSAKPFTHVYYFATSQIFRQKAEAFSRRQLESFLEVYLHGFDALCGAVTAAANRVKVFYPSSVAIDEPPKDSVEYVIAKAAGEILASALDKRVPGLTVITERLPRTDTDQTATVLPVKSASAVEVMSPIIERMHALGA